MRILFHKLFRDRFKSELKRIRREMEIEVLEMSKESRNAGKEVKEFTAAAALLTAP